MSATYENPRTWPLWLRRTFILTLPISVPLWLAGFVLMGVAVVVIMAFVCTVLMPIDFIAKLWRPQ